MAHADAPLASRLNYAQCWEDVRMLSDALAPAVGRRVLSIASAGDNSIALALAGAEVDAIDLSAPQLALCRLKCAAAKLDYGDFRVLFGVDTLAMRRRCIGACARTSTPRRERGSTASRGAVRRRRARFGPVRRVSPAVSNPHPPADPPARRPWSAGSSWTTQRPRVGPTGVGSRTPAGNALFRLFFSRTVMAARGRSREQFAHVRGPIGDVLSARTERVLTELPIRDNGYVQWILFGAIVFDEALPPWLSEAGHRQLGEAARRIRWLHAPLGDHLAAAGSRTYDAYNLSDLFEYLDHPTTAALYDGVVRAGSPGARVAYWNLFVPRHRPEALADRVVRRTDDAARLYARDRAFVYGAFQVEEVVAP
jgi:S-adenosylmethionine-diacylglycerol 3-amino-3-carboxypropyl transferase